MRNVAFAGFVGLLALSVSGCGGDDGGDDGTSGAGGTGASSSGGSGGGTGATGGNGGSAGAGNSGGTGGSGGSGGSAGAAGGGTGGSGGNSCTDPGPEPNDSIVFATPACPLPCELDECDDEGSTGYGGTIAPVTGVTGPNDPDHFKFDGIDDVGLCLVNVGAKTAESGFRLCAFASCKTGGTVFGGCNSGTQTDSDGIMGCCTDAPGEVDLDYDCSGSGSDNDSGTAVIRVDSATACTPYTVDFHF